MKDPFDEAKNPNQAKKDFIKYLHEDVFQLNFYRVHMAYFIIVTMVTSVIFYGEGLADDSSEENGSPLRFIDALFLCCSSMTTTGLNTVNMGSLTGFQQAMIAVLLVIGNVVFVSAFVVVIRRHYFRRKLKDVLQTSEAGKTALEDVERQEGIRPINRLRHRHHINHNNRDPKISRSHHRSSYPSKERQRRRHHQTGFGGLPAPWETETLRKILRFPFHSLGHEWHKLEHTYFSFEPALDSKGRIRNLNEHERAELGGIEYRALSLLLWILVAYHVSWVVLGTVMLVPYAYRENVKDIITTSQPGNLSPGWWAFFAVITSFCNGGLNLLNSNFIPFQSYYYILIVCGGLAFAGNIMFPIFLRLICWCLAKLTPRSSRFHQTILFLLHHPRRCLIYLFPAKETWYLFIIQVLIELVSWVLFIVLNIGMPAVEAISPGTRVFDGIFQGTGLRTSGSYVINMSYLAPALLVSYIVAMYISNFPIIMALRQTNIYEERSIGLDKSDSGGGLATHLRRQLAYDIWFQILAWFLICIIERGKLNSSQPGFSIFSILFEVTSAYGTVGLSTGVPYDSYSLSGAFQTGSKLVMCAVMIRGRHRGLPLAIDRSILLPGEDTMAKIDHEYNEYGEIDEGEQEQVRRDEEKSGKKGDTIDEMGQSEQDSERERYRGDQVGEGSST